MRNLANAIHPDDRADPAVAPRRARIVRINRDESPLRWLSSRSLITNRQLAAGEQLRRDFAIAGLEPGVTMRWDATPRGQISGSSGDNQSVARIDAHRRFSAAIDAVGSGLSDICWRVVCAGEAMPGAERALGWPSRSGRIILALALDRLADHYRLPGG